VQSPENDSVAISLPGYNRSFHEKHPYENWLWEAACVIRGAVDAPKYNGYILPLIFLKRLSDVF